jgi:hypothetical protein
MQKLSVTLDKHSKYLIELKEEYDLREFMTVFEGHISKIKKLASLNHDLPERKTNKGKARDRAFHANELFEQLDVMIEKLGDDIIKTDGNTMRTYSSIIKSNNKRRGLAWLQPSGNSLIIYLRKGDHSDVDKKEQIIYPTLGKSTFGNYPMIKISDPTEVGYIFDIIKSIYES